MLEADPDIDMVLSDINMPRMDGLTLLDQIPKVSPNLRSVIISAYGDMKNIRTAMNRGAFDFVTKPVDFDDLRFTIDRTLQHVEELREALNARDKLVAIQNELEVASTMQQSILPTSFPSSDTYKVFGTMQPAREVGGDFFDVMRLQGEQVGLAIADVSGKGVPAALFMMSSRTLLKGAAIGVEGPGAVLSEVNNLLHEDNSAQMFVTMLYAIYNPTTRTFHLFQRRPRRPPPRPQRRHLHPSAPDQRHRSRHSPRLRLSTGNRPTVARRHHSPLHRRRHRGNEHGWHPAWHQQGAEHLYRGAARRRGRGGDGGCQSRGRLRPGCSPVR